MTQQRQAISTILFTSLMLAFAAPASAEIVQCVASTGTVTFTDRACGADTISSAVTGWTETAPAANAAPLLHNGRFAAAEKARTLVWANKSAVARRLAVDVATMSAAKASMEALDIESALSRQQARAEKESESSSWAFWRS